MMKSTLIVSVWLALAGIAGAQVWTESGDAPSFPDGPAQVTRGQLALTSIVGTTDSAGGDLRDAYCVRIADPSSFLATTDPQTDPGAGADFDTRLFLLRSEGAPVLANDDTPAAPGLMSTVTGVATDLSGFVLSQPGEYILVVDGFPDDPQDAMNVDLFDIGTDFELVHAANPAAGRFDHWEDAPTTDTGSYTMVLAGVEHCQGDLDAVFADSGGNSNDVCLGNGAGGFACSDVSADMNFTEDVALGFVDGDPNLDAVFGNFNQRNRVCLGIGAGGFACSDVSAPNTTRGLALGFVDGDQNLDAVFANSPNSNQVCLGDGAGGFTCNDTGFFTNTPSGVNPSRGVALGFVDGDQNLDAVFANGNQTNWVCLGNGAGGLSCSDVSTDMGFTEEVALGFVDGDPNLDAVFGNNGSPNRLCLGDGLGGFTSCSNVTTGADTTHGVALGEVAFFSQIFADGFESGNTSAWSSSVP